MIVIVVVICYCSNRKKKQREAGESGSPEWNNEDNTGRQIELMNVEMKKE